MVAQEAARWRAAVQRSGGATASHRPPQWCALRPQAPLLLPWLTSPPWAPLSRPLCLQGLRVLLVDGCGAIDNVAVSLRSPSLAYDGE